MPQTDLSIESDTQMPVLLMHYPQTRSVLNRYGLHGCGGTHGPAESLRIFARAHEVDEELLLAELRLAAQTPTDLTAWALDAEPQVDDTIYRRFFLAAIAVVLISGAAWGTWILWRIGIARSFVGISIFDVNAHGHAQIFGWIGLFIMGFAYQAFPRFWRTRLVMPNLAIMVFVGMLIGLIVKTIAMTAAGDRGAVAVATTGGVLELAAILVFAWQIESTFMRSSALLEPWIGFVFVALVFFVLQTLMSIWHTWMIMTASSDYQLLWSVSTYQSPLRDLQIHGMAMLMILGVSLRMIPALYRAPKIADRRAWTVLAILSAAVIGEVVLFIAYQRHGGSRAAALLLVPWSMIAVGVAIIVFPWKFWRPLRDIEGHTDRSGKFIRVAYAWLMISLAMLLLLPIYQLATGIVFSHAYFGAARHAVAVGFISLMIMGFAAKVVPTLNGIDPRGLSRLWGPFLLINIGCFLRVTMQTLTDSHPAFFPFVGVSGVLELTALAWWATELLQTMKRGRVVSSVPVQSAKAPNAVGANHHVADVLEWFPGSEAIFIKHGFSAIGNPILRRTLARQVSIAQAAAMRGVLLEPLLSDLNRVALGRAAGNDCGRCTH